MSTSVEIAQSREHDAKIGERVHTIMWRERLTQGDVAGGLGITQPALSRKLRGERPWTIGELYALTRILNQPLLVLLGAENLVENGAELAEAVGSETPGPGAHSAKYVPRNVPGEGAHNPK